MSSTKLLSLTLLYTGLVGKKLGITNPQTESRDSIATRESLTSFTISAWIPYRFLMILLAIKTILLFSNMLTDIRGAI